MNRAHHFGRIILLILLSCAPVTAAPTPTVALVDLATDPGLGPSLEVWSRNLTAALQADLVGEAGVTWVERARLDKVWEELALGIHGRVAAGSAVRLGHWVGADWLMVGKLDRGPKQELRARLQIIEVRRAALLAESEIALPAPPPHPLGIEPLVEAGRALVRTALARARMEESAAVIAPLFFANTGATDRIDFIEERLKTALSARDKIQPDLRVLDFARPNESTEENELALLGLTDHDAAAWQSAADLYAWGSFEEMPAPAGSFDDQPVAIRVTVWDGVNEPGELKWSGPIRDLTTGINDLAGRITAAARHRPSTHQPKATDAHRKLARA